MAIEQQGASQLSKVIPASKTIWGHEPAWWTAVAQAGIIFIVTFWIHLTDVQTGAIIAVVNAVMGTLLALLVRPINVAVFNTLAQAIITLVMTFGLDFPSHNIGAVSGLLGMVLSYTAVRPQVVPVLTLTRGLTETQPNLPAGV
jgi:hypothetical protein